MGMNSRRWANGDNNRTLHQAEFTDMGSLSRDFAFNVAAWEARRDANSVFLTGSRRF